MAENIINKNLSGFTKEMLDMTYPDEYYKNTIQPAKAGTGPVPSKMQMFSKFQPGKAMMIGMDPYLPGFMQQGYDKFRAAPTQAVKNIAGTLGKGITSLASLPAQAAFFTLGSTPANASEANMSPEDFRALGEAEGITYGSFPITSSPFVDAGRDFSMFDQAKMGDAVSGTNVEDLDYEADLGAFMNPNIQPSQNMFQRAGNAIQSGIGSMRDFAGKGMDLGKMAMSGIGNAIMPGLGFLMSNLKPEPLFRETLSNSRKENNTLQSLGLDGVGNFGGFTTDDLGRVVNTGNYITPENIMSGYNAGFDLAGSALGRIGTIQRAIDKGRFKDKFALDRANKKIDALKTAAVASAQAKRQAYQDQIDRAKNEAAANRARAKSITAGYGGYDDSPGATGPTASGAGMGYGGGYASDYGFKKDGGMIGYRDGGLASMFVRRG